MTVVVAGRVFLRTDIVLAGDDDAWGSTRRLSSNEQQCCKGLQTFPILAVKVGPVLEKIAHPFFENVGTPMSTEDVRQCEMHEEVAQPGRLEHICVEERPQMSPRIRSRSPGHRLPVR